MKTIVALVFAMSAAISAQAQSPIKSNNMQEEVRATSASLKEAYGILSQDLAHLGREIGPDASKATAEQAALRERMKTALSQLEGLLTTVNTVGEDQWAAAKAKAEQTRASALAIVEERKTKSGLRVISGTSEKGEVIILGGGHLSPLDNRAVVVSDKVKHAVYHYSTYFSLMAQNKMLGIVLRPIVTNENFSRKL